MDVGTTAQQPRAIGNMIRFGLCCIFRDQPIKFRTTTATANGKMKRAAALEKLSDLSMANAVALQAALQFCADNGIGCFRINSQILPLPEPSALILLFVGCLVIVSTVRSQ